MPIKHSTAAAFLCDLQTGIQKTFLLLGFGLLLLIPISSQAADTLENYAVGATNVDFYTGLGDLGGPINEASIYGDLLLGYGLSKRMSAYLGTTIRANAQLNTGAAALGLGVYGTAVESDHFDIDVMLGFCAGGHGLSEIVVTPGLELNLDNDQGMNSFGAYMRILWPLYGRQNAPITHDRDGLSTSLIPKMHVDITVGSYVAVWHGHQLLLEYSCAYTPLASTLSTRFDVGGIALGYNFQVVDNIEMITQIQLAFPSATRNNQTRLGLSIGLIASLPSLDA